MKKLKSNSILVFALVAVITTAPLTVLTNPVGAHTRTVKIRVDRNGFSPASIDAEAGHKLNLVFRRADKDNCGGVVVFPKRGIRKALPVNRDVIVSITPRDAGQISFTCGMGMYKGSIVVSEG
jgi:P-type Cu+ transporter